MEIRFSFFYSVSATILCTCYPFLWNFAETSICLNTFMVRSGEKIVRHLFHDKQNFYPKYLYSINYKLKFGKKKKKKSLLPVRLLIFRKWGELKLQISWFSAAIRFLIVIWTSHNRKTFKMYDYYLQSNLLFKSCKLLRIAVIQNIFSKQLLNLIMISA